MRIFLAAVFAVAAAAKLSDRRGAERAIVDMGLPSGLAPLLARAVPALELAIAAMLLPAASAWWGGLAALGLLVAFTSAISINLLRGRAPDCHCFGQLTAGPIGRGTLVRNLLLMTAAALLVVSPQRTVQRSAVAWLVELTAGERALVATGLVAVALLAAVAGLLVRLLRQNERLIAALAEARMPFEDEAEEPVVRRDMALPSSGLPVGAPAPPFRLADLDGNEATLADLLRPNLPLVLVFVSPTCGPCEALLADVARWRERYGRFLSIALISKGGREANLQKFAGAGPVWLQSGSEVAESFEARWMPAAAAVKADGSVASPLANGSEAIRHLIIQTVNAASAGAAAGLLEAGSNGHGGAPAVQVGAPAPPLALPDLDGKTVTLDDFKGARTLVVFWSPDCTFCEQVLVELKRLEANPPAHAPQMLVISKGPVEANRAAGLRSRVVLDDDFKVGKQFGASGTPSAVLIDERGRIASEVVGGGPRILQLAGVRTAAH